MKTVKKLVSILLCVVMMLTIMPVNLYTVEADTPVGGESSREYVLHVSDNGATKTYNVSYNGSEYEYNEYFQSGPNFSVLSANDYNISCNSVSDKKTHRYTFVSNNSEANFWNNSNTQNCYATVVSDNDSDNKYLGTCVVCGGEVIDEPTLVPYVSYNSTHHYCELKKDGRFPVSYNQVHKYNDVVSENGLKKVSECTVCKYRTNERDITYSIKVVSENDVVKLDGTSNKFIIQLLMNGSERVSSNSSSISENLLNNYKISINCPALDDTYEGFKITKVDKEVVDGDSYTISANETAWGKSLTVSVNATISGNNLFSPTPITFVINAKNPDREVSISSNETVVNANASISFDVNTKAAPGSLSSYDYNIYDGATIVSSNHISSNDMNTTISLNSSDLSYIMNASHKLVEGTYKIKVSANFASAPLSVSSNEFEFTIKDTAVYKLELSDSTSGVIISDNAVVNANVPSNWTVSVNLLKDNNKMDSASANATYYKLSISANSSNPAGMYTILSSNDQSVSENNKFEIKVSNNAWNTEGEFTVYAYISGNSANTFAQKIFKIKAETSNDSISISRNGTDKVSSNGKVSFNTTVSTNALYPYNLNYELYYNDVKISSNNVSAVSKNTTISFNCAKILEWSKHESGEKQYGEYKLKVSSNIRNKVVSDNATFTIVEPNYSYEIQYEPSAPSANAIELGQSKIVSVNLVRKGDGNTNISSNFPTAKEYSISVTPDTKNGISVTSVSNNIVGDKLTFTASEEAWDKTAEFDVTAYRNNQQISTNKIIVKAAAPDLITVSSNKTKISANETAVVSVNIKTKKTITSVSYNVVSANGDVISANNAVTPVSVNSIITLKGDDLLKWANSNRKNVETYTVSVNAILSGNSVISKSVTISVNDPEVNPEYTYKLFENSEEVSTPREFKLGETKIYKVELYRNNVKVTSQNTLENDGLSLTFQMTDIGSITSNHSVKYVSNDTLEVRVSNNKSALSASTNLVLKGTTSEGTKFEKTYLIKVKDDLDFNASLSATPNNANKKYDIGSNVTFNTTVTNTEDRSGFTYQYVINNNPSTYSATSSYNLANIEKKSYTVYANVKDSLGVVVSTNAITIQGINPLDEYKFSQFKIDETTRVTKNQKTKVNVSFVLNKAGLNEADIKNYVSFNSISGTYVEKSDINVTFTNSAKTNGVVSLTIKGKSLTPSSGVKVSATTTLGVESGSKSSSGIIYVYDVPEVTSDYSAGTHNVTFSLPKYIGTLYSTNMQVTGYKVRVYQGNSPVQTLPAVTTSSASVTINVKNILDSITALSGSYDTFKIAILPVGKCNGSSTVVDAKNDNDDYFESGKTSEITVYQLTASGGDYVTVTPSSKWRFVNDTVTLSASVSSGYLASNVKWMKKGSTTVLSTGSSYSVTVSSNTGDNAYFATLGTCTHSGGTRITKLADCTKECKVSYNACEKCGMPYEGTWTARTSHDFVNGKCTYCDVVQAKIEIIKGKVGTKKYDVIDTLSDAVQTYIINHLKDFFTDAEIELLNKGTELSIYGEVKTYSSSSMSSKNKKLFKAELSDGYAVAQYYDISMKARVGNRAAKKIQPGTGNYVQVTLPVPSSLKGATIKDDNAFEMLHLLEDGTVEALPCTYDSDDKTFTFQTDSFSYFALTYDKDEVKKKTTTTTPVINWPGIGTGTGNGNGTVIGIGNGTGNGTTYGGSYQWVYKDGKWVYQFVYSDNQFGDMAGGTLNGTDYWLERLMAIFSRLWNW